MKRTISKQNRVLLNVALMTIALVLAHFFSGMASPILRLQFRMEERAKLIGPSRIIGVEQIDFSRCDRMIVAETEAGVILWISGRNYDSSGLVYRERDAGNLLVAPSGSLGNVLSGDEAVLPLVLVDDQPRARRAELRFTLKTNYNGEDFERNYTLTAERAAQGYFLFSLSAGTKDSGPYDAESTAVQIFGNVCAGLEKNPEYAVPVQVLYYDAGNKLIAQETIIVSCT